MPILYEPPQPFAPSISASYGQAEQFDRIAPLLAQQQIANQHAQLQAAAIGQQGAIAAGHQMMQEEQFRQGLYQHGYDAAAGRNLAAAEADARIRAAPELARQHAELSAWLSNQEMTQAENMRMQRMQGAVAQVQQDMNEHRLSEEDGYALITQLRTGIDSYKQRQEKALARQEEMRASLFDQQAQKIKAHEAAQAKLDAMEFNDRLSHVIDPAVRAQVEAELGPVNPAEAAMIGEPAARARREQKILEMAAARGGVHSFYQESPGKFVPIDKGGKAAADAGKDREHEFKIEQSAYDRWQKGYHEAIAQVDKWRAETVENDEGKKVPKHPNLENDEAYYAQIWKIMDEKKLGRDPEAYARKAVGDYRGRSGGGGQAGAQPPAGGGGGGQPGGGGAAPVEARPFSITDPKSMSPDQSAKADEYRNQLAILADRRDIPADKKKEYENALHTWMNLYERYGSREQILAGPDRAAYESARKVIEAIPARRPIPTERIEPKGRLTRAGEAFRRGDLVTGEDVRRAAEKFNRGELVTTEDIGNLFR